MINSVIKAVAILKLFNMNEPRLSLTDISQRLRLPKSTAHNFLNTLLACGLIEKVDDKHYALGTEVVALTQGVRVNVEIRDRAAPLLRDLADTCHESAYLAVFDHDRCLYIYGVESPRRLLARTATGDRSPLHCTALGKAILAFLPSKEMEATIERVELSRFTDATIVDLEALRQELLQIRASGYSLDRAEHERGTYCIGAPIFNERGMVIGGCSISGTDPAIIRDRLASLAPAVMNTGLEISRRMGYVPSRNTLSLAAEMAR
jgi:DNA-binding IclR family transcriptional regulator